MAASLQPRPDDEHPRGYYGHIRGVGIYERDYGSDEREGILQLICETASKAACGDYEWCNMYFTPAAIAALQAEILDAGPVEVIDGR